METKTDDDEVNRNMIPIKSSKKPYHISQNNFRLHGDAKPVTVHAALISTAPWSKGFPPQLTKHGHNTLLMKTIIYAFKYRCLTCFCLIYAM